MNVGDRFGRLVVVELLPSLPVRPRHGRASVRCDCGTGKVVLRTSLKTGQVVSCGCWNEEKKYQHGHTLEKHSPTFNSWDNMVQRCTNPKRKEWKNYGGRGITVCERWLSFENFLADMGERPAGKTLDRKNNNGNYE